MSKNVVSTSTWKRIGVLTDKLNSNLSRKIHVKLEFSRKSLGKRNMFVINEFKDKYLSTLIASK